MTSPENRASIFGRKYDGKDGLLLTAPVQKDPTVSSAEKLLNCSKPKQKFSQMVVQSGQILGRNLLTQAILQNSRKSSSTPQNLQKALEINTLEDGAPKNKSKFVHKFARFGSVETLGQSPVKTLHLPKPQPISNHPYKESPLELSNPISTMGAAYQKTAKEDVSHRIDQLEQMDMDLIGLLAKMDVPNLFEELVIKSGNPMNTTAKKYLKCAFRGTHPRKKIQDWFDSKSLLEGLGTIIHKKNQPSHTHPKDFEDLVRDQGFDFAETKSRAKNLKYKDRDYSKKDNSYLIHLRNNPKQPGRLKIFKKKFLQGKSITGSQVQILHDKYAVLLGYLEYFNEHGLFDREIFGEGKMTPEKFLARVGKWDPEDRYPCLAVNSLRPAHEKVSEVGGSYEVVTTSKCRLESGSGSKQKSRPRTS
jgi:hypothetical protein